MSLGDAIRKKLSAIEARALKYEMLTARDRYSLGATLHYRRNQTSTTQEQLAKKVYLDLGMKEKSAAIFISNVECGKVPVTHQQLDIILAMLYE